jgi:hypothetical protein
MLPNRPSTGNASMPQPDGRDPFEEFAIRLAAAGGSTALLSSLSDVVTLIREVPGAGDEEPVWISHAVDAAFPGLAGILRDAGIAHQLASGASEVRDAALGVTVAELAIVETGSVLLNEPALADRSVSLMTDRLIVLCPADKLVSSLDEAAPVLRQIAANGPSYATFVTGPSRTADIERELAIGVQGPGVLTVAFSGA